MMNKLIHAYVEPEGCWHMIRTVIWDNKQEDTYAPPIAALKFIDRWDVYEIHCSCGEVVLHGISFPNPDYSTREHFPDLTAKLFGDREMWRLFVYQNHNINNECTRLSWADYTAWLFSDNSRFCSLFAEFLRLPETIEEFGMMDCPCPPEFKGDEEIVRVCPYCHGTGRILKPWARLAGEVSHG